MAGFSFAVLAAGYAGSVALGINAPPAEIGADPLGRNRVEALTGETANLFEAFPGILGALQALHALGFCFFYRGFFHYFSRCGWNCHKNFRGNKKPTARLLWRWVISAGIKKKLLGP
jgi:hypothetical protein